MRILLLLDSFKNVPAAARTIAIAQNFLDAGAEVGIVAFRPGGELFAEARKRNLPVRVQQFFDSRLNFYAPGLTGAVLFFRPDAVIFCAPGTLFHGGPLSRAFRGLRMFSISEFSSVPSWFVRHALRRMIGVLAPNERSREILAKFLPAEKILPLDMENLLAALAR